MAKSKKAFGYFKYGKESQATQAGVIVLVLGSVIFLYLVAARLNYI